MQGERSTVGPHPPSPVRAKAHDVKIMVVGGGLAGCEAAWQLASRGHDVALHEQKPLKRTPAQQTDHLAELVCSNSLRGAALSNAVGLLKEELRRVGSLVMTCADRAKVPAGGALAVDREQFARAITEAIHGHPRIRRVSAEVTALPAEQDRPAIIATGPLTSESLAADLERAAGGHLAYYDAIAPIVAHDSIDHERVFAASRWDKGTEAGDARIAVVKPQDGGDRAYLNAPMTRDEYEAFVDALLGADKVAPREFEDARYFEGCLPVEVMAERGRETLRHGPMKPVGLTDPRTGRWPHAVVQLRQEDAGGTAWNLVGFQTRMTYGAQSRVLRMIPGLGAAEILRFGTVHRNTFVHAPRVLDETMQLKGSPGIFLAGQITGVEGYVESAAGGYLCALLLCQRLCGAAITPPPPTTALGGLRTHLSRDPGDKHGFQPSNVNWSLVPPLSTDRDAKGRRLPKVTRYEAMAARALSDLEGWLLTAPLARCDGFDRPRSGAHGNDAADPARSLVLE
ncbi:MAG: methylenetetrahydrofolate--tRNA-(uracil(54)-C(5))-methyltransferase (FADH(2)-oxidizing) TrmFO [Polyangiales bacterium]